MRTIYVMLALSLCISLATADADALEYTLNVFGNANLDGMIDLKDIAYVDAVIKGTETPTKLSDANNDGKINDEDLTRIEQIIKGDEKEITLIDSANRTVTVKTPVKRIILAYMGPHEPAIILAKDRIVGMVDHIKTYRGDILNATGLSNIPTCGVIGNIDALDYERIIELNPDMLLTISSPSVSDEIPDKLPTIPVVSLDCDRAGAIKMVSEIKVLGLILGEDEKADELINFILKYEGIIENRTAGLDENEKPSFYIETYADFVTYGSQAYDGSVAAGCGGKNIVDGAGFKLGEWGEVTLDPEWVLSQNPDVIFMRDTSYLYAFDSTENDLENQINKRTNRTGWEKLSAVNNRKVYMYNEELCFSPRYIVGRLYFAKWLHPDLFKDIDPEKIHAEYWKQFLGVDLTGTWAYPLTN